MQAKYFLPEKGRFYKANLHSHSTYSDGELTVEEAKEYYKANGYSVYAFTDHNNYQHHKHLNDENFLALAGFESDFTQQDEDLPWGVKRTFHINFVDAKPDEKVDEKKRLCQNRPTGYDVEAINDFIKKLTDLGCLATYNHPAWSLQDLSDYSRLKNLFAMEIGNYGCEVEGSYGWAPQVYVEMLRSGQRLHCISTDDNHNRSDKDSPYCDSFGGYTMIKAEELTYEAIINAMVRGEFYCVNGIGGPQIHAFYWDGNEVVVQCSNVKSIYLANQTRNYRLKRAGEGEYLTEARFPLEGTEGYIRLDVVDEYGRHGYTSAYFLDSFFQS